MSITNFLFNPVRSTTLSIIELFFNSTSGEMLNKVIKVAGAEKVPSESLILKVKQMIKHIAINVDEKKNLLLINLLLAGEEKELELTINYSKDTRIGETNIQILNINSSRTWITILVNDILINEGIISADNMKISTDGFVGKLLNKIL